MCKYKKSCIFVTKQPEKNMEQNSICKNLRALREVLGYSQEQVAHYLEIERVMISYYETGARPVPAPVLVKLAEFYNVELKDLFEEKPLNSKLNYAFAFRASDIADEDLKVIARFKRIAKTYIDSKNKLSGIND